MKQVSNSHLVEAVTSYTDLFQKNFFDFKTKGNKIASPLGSWVLLALTSGAGAKTYSSEEREKLESILGDTLENAFTSALKLLNNTPEDIKLRAASWVKKNFSNREDVSQWLDELLKIEGVNPKNYLPSQKEADDWATVATLDLIKKFPIDMTNNDLVFVLTTVIATKITWNEPFKEAKNISEMSSWGQKKVLESNVYEETFLIEENNNIFCVHAKDSGTEDPFKLKVISVIGPDNISSRKLAKLANNIAANFDDYRNRKLNLFDINLGKKFSYLKITEFEKEATDKDTQSITTFLPAWDAESVFDITEFGFIDSAKGITRSPDFEAKALQVAIASYNKKGFEAAAISSLYMVVTGMPPRPKRRLVRHANVYFSHSYAVVAVTTKPFFNKKDINKECAIWQNLPVFVAWVDNSSAVSE